MKQSTKINQKNISVFLTSSLVIISAMILSACKENDKPQAKNSNNATFYVDDLKSLSFVAVGDANSQGKQDKKLLTLEACLKDNAGTNSVSEVQFKVIAGEVAALKKTDRRGCLQWQELIEYDVTTGEEKNIFMSRSVEAIESHTGSEKTQFSVNPWKDQFVYNRQGSSSSSVNDSNLSFKPKSLQISSSLGFDYDIFVKVNERSNGILSPIKRQTEITTLRLDYRTIDYSKIEVDQKLNITLPYTYVTNLSIGILKQTLGQISQEKIQMGNFQFHLVFLKEKTTVTAPKASDVIAAVEFKGKPRGDAGLVEVPITVKFNKLAALSSRMSVLLTVTSLDEQPLFNEQTYEGSVDSIVANQDLEIALIPNSSNAKELYGSYVYEMENANKVALTPSQVLASESFKSVENPMEIKFPVLEAHSCIFGHCFDADKKTVVKENGKVKFHAPVNLLKVLENIRDNQELSLFEKKAVCSAYFQGQIKSEEDVNYVKCLNAPESLLAVEVREFVNSVNGNPSLVSFGRPEGLELTASFQIAQADSVNSGWAAESNIGGKIEAGVSAGVGGEWGNQEESKISRSNSKSNSNSDSKSFEKIDTNETKTNNTSNSSKTSKTTLASKTKENVGSSSLENSAKNGVQAAAKAGLEANIGIGGKLYNAVGFDKSSKDAQAMSITSTEALAVQPIQLTMSVKVQKCMLIVSKLNSEKTAKLLPNLKSRFICLASKDVVRTENYYLMDHAKVVKSNAIADSNSATVNTLRMLVRGDKPYGILKSLLASKETKARILLTPWEKENINNKLEDPSLFMSQEAPLMLSSVKMILM